VSFPHFCAFKDGGPKMIWDFNSSSMEELNVDERERAMGSRTYTSNVFNISKGTHNQILGQVMDLNCLTWVFCLTLAKQTYLDQYFLPTHPTSRFVAPLIGIVMLVRRGMIL